jgi:hypothetical protein
MSHAATQSAIALAVRDPAAAVPDGLRARSRAAAASRFAVYRNNVAVGLVSALRARFPVVAALVGDDFFRAMARSYVAGTRPSTPFLVSYGDDFPDFIEAFAPAATVPYLADVARFEIAVSEAYHAREASPLEPAAFGALAPDDLFDTRVVLHPAARLVRSPHPVGSIWSAHGDGGRPEAIRWAAETVLVTRPEAEIRVRSLNRAEEVFVAALFAGRSLGEAHEHALRTGGDFDFGRALLGATNAGAFTALRTDAEEPR